MLVQNDKTSCFRLNLGQQLSSFSTSFLGKLLRDAVAIDMKTAVISLAQFLFGDPLEHISFRSRCRPIIDDNK